MIYKKFGSGRPIFSVISCTHKPSYYTQNVLRSLEHENLDHELIAYNNCQNSHSVPKALNMALEQASGCYIVACHHDVVFPYGWLDLVLKEISKVNEFDPGWGVLGVMGVGPFGNHLGAIDDPHSKRMFGPLPAKVQTLDEACLIFRNNDGMMFAEDLGSHHLYGIDLCIQSTVNGRSCYAVEAPIRHLSGGILDDEYRRTARILARRWRAVKNAPAVIETPCSVIVLKSGLICKAEAFYRFARRKLIWKMGSIRDLKHL